MSGIRQNSRGIDHDVLIWARDNAPVWSTELTGSLLASMPHLAGFAAELKAYTSDVILQTLAAIQTQLPRDPQVIKTAVRGSAPGE